MRRRFFGSGRFDGLIPSRIKGLLPTPTNPARNDRRHRSQSDQRTPYQRDQDRILYTDNFQRLSGITQVARTGESYIYHDRLSHSLKVAQIGRRLTELLLENAPKDLLSEYEGPNPDVVETAALAHDMGHPPFGHAAEQELDDCVRESGVEEGFEANAQTFRIVTQLATHREEYRGLDLTRASLNAVLKYPWARGENEDKPSKWGYYHTEKEDFNFARRGFADQRRSIEAEIMDWSDDVAYAVHDLDDFYRANLIPFDQILTDSQEREEFLDHIEDCEHVSFTSDWGPELFLDHLQNTVVDPLKKPFSGTNRQKSVMNAFTSHLIERYIGQMIDESVYLDAEKGRLELQIHHYLENEVDLLSEMTRYYIINNSSLMAQQFGQRKVIRKLYRDLMKQALPGADHRGIIPRPYRDDLKSLEDSESKDQRARIVVDLLTSMTEQQTLKLYERLEGTTPGSLQDRIIR